jgi:cytochrome c biogenesis protein CcdA/thiol-disulfide isomerase/thioredoxin
LADATVNGIERSTGETDGPMALLVIFAILAGAGTALTPCVLPVLPALLSASATGGRRRPLGVIAGLVLTHTITIVALASVIDGVGLADGFTRTAAIVVLAGFGLALLWPRLGLLVERAFAPLQRLGPRSGGSGFWSGVLVGGALGFLYAPCAGPILAAVISVSATQGTSADLVLLALAYGAGSAAVLLLLAFGGRRVVDRVRRAGHGPTVQHALGVLLIGTAVAMAAELDVRFQTVLANELPSVVSNPTGAIERSAGIERRLADLRGPSRFDLSRTAGAAPRADLPVLGKAPDFTGNDAWLNTRPLSLEQLRGRVVLIDFWTYTCINCLRTLPQLRAWDARYRDDGLTIVGVHTPEFAFERELDNVERAVRRNGLRYPVAQDNSYATWDAWGNQYWPAKYLIDAEGRVRYTHFGEGAYEETETAIRALLAEAGRDRLGDMTRARTESPDPGVATPETYLGFARADGFVPSRPRPGTNRYPPVRDGLDPSRFALSGVWRVDEESATAVSGAAVHARVVARKVFLVLSARGPGRHGVEVLLDGEPLRRVVVRSQRLYPLVSLPEVADRRLTLRVDPGVSAYAFTFG